MERDEQDQPLSETVDLVMPKVDNESTIAEERRAGGFAPGDVFGDYEIKDEIARGGMGVVYRAIQKSLNRSVAIKFILTGKLSGRDGIRRFQAEAKAAAVLDHPHITPIYEVGELNGQHYFSMRLIEGGSLADEVKKGPLPCRDAATLTAKIAEALQYAHDQGVVHRDIKPGNVLLNAKREPFVTDFGIAKQLETDEHFTATGQVLGTPGYLPPEQASGDLKQIGPRSDIYSVGAMLYCLLTGRPPFQCSNVVDTLFEVLGKDPAPPRLLNGKIDADLELICLKCLEKDPRHRYATATELAADLNRYLEGESISIASLNLFNRLSRTLTSSKHDAAFREWAAILFWFAVIVFAADFSIFLLGFRGEAFSHVFNALPIRLVQFICMGLVLWAYRKHWAGSSGAIERQMWAGWIGFLIACHVVAVPVEANFNADIPNAFFAAYPFFLLLSGFLIFSYGGSHWGFCYVLGVLFFIAGAVMPFQLAFAPLVFGILWAASLSAIGFRLRHLGRES